MSQDPLRYHSQWMSLFHSLSHSRPSDVPGSPPLPLTVYDEAGDLLGGADSVGDLTGDVLEVGVSGHLGHHQLGAVVVLH